MRIWSSNTEQEGNRPNVPLLLSRPHIYVHTQYVRYVFIAHSSIGKFGVEPINRSRQTAKINRNKTRKINSVNSFFIQVPISSKAKNEFLISPNQRIRNRLADLKARRRKNAIALKRCTLTSTHHKYLHTNRMWCDFIITHV